MSTKYATRDDFLKPAVRRYKDIELPVSGQHVRIRSLFEGEKEAYEAEMIAKKGGMRQDKVLNARRRLVVLCLVDGNGDQLLTANDLETLKQLDGADMGFMQEEVMVHVGFKEGDIESLVKNSEVVHVEDSPSG